MSTTTVRQVCDGWDAWDDRGIVVHFPAHPTEPQVLTAIDQVIASAAAPALPDTGTDIEIETEDGGRA